MRTPDDATLGGRTLSLRGRCPLNFGSCSDLSLEAINGHSQQADGVSALSDSLRVSDEEVR